MAVPLEVVHASNAQLKSLKPGLVGVFVGGTSGLGEAALRAFAKYTISPKIYIVGRNETAASTIAAEVQKLNPGGSVHFVKSDTSLLKNVDIACKEIQAKEDKVNVLFLSSGYLTMAGRQETSEGIDRKFCLNYHSRWRFVQNLLPQLTAASEEPKSLSRVITVLAAGRERALIEDDLELKNNFSLSNCANHATVFNSLAVEELAKQYPATAFVHLSPGIVKTGIMNSGGRLMKWSGMLLSPLLSPFCVPIGESGERNLYHATSSQFAPKNTAGEDAAIGSDGVTKGTGAYLLNWDGKVTGEQKVLNALREKGFGPKIWEHTQNIFKEATK